MTARPKIITISGYPGSGTTTLAERLGKRFDLPVVSAGAVFRRMAEEQGLSLQEFGVRADRDPEIDRALDARMLATVKETGNCVAEGRLTGALVPDATLRVWLHAPQSVRFVRVWTRSGESPKEMERREQHEAHRYSTTYGIWIHDCEHYDLCIDTKRLPVTAVEEIAAVAYALRLAAQIREMP